MQMFDAVMEFTRLNINEIYKMPAVDFFTYLSYINQRNLKKQMEQRQELARQRAKMKSHR